ncbi:unnamed protein product [Heterobilharzia americana]|nr:unnamed protein product [Heterobilharzia americana]
MEHHDTMTMMNLNKSWWNVFMHEWRKKQNEWIKLYNEKGNSSLNETNCEEVNHRNLDNTDLPWLPDRFIEEMEKREIFQMINIQ